jgi:hypothetical protein
MYIYIYILDYLIERKSSRTNIELGIVRRHDGDVSENKPILVLR